MELVDILARDLEQWPAGAAYVFQRGTTLYACYKTLGRQTEHRIKNIEHATDSGSFYVTEPEWEELKRSKSSWTKQSIPAGSTHSRLSTRGDGSTVYYRWYEGYFCMWKDGNWIRAICNPSDVEIIPIPKQEAPAAWNGEGLPPIGTVCVFAGGYSCPSDPWDKDLHEGDKVTIIAHFLDGVTELAAFTFNASIRNRYRGAACVEQGSSGCFRPIRTAEQIAAEEQKKASINKRMIIGEMLDERHSGDSLHEFALRLFEAGYRKQSQS